MKILRVKKSCNFGLRFEALGVLRSKSWRKQTHIFFEKKLGYVFYNFLIRATIWSQIAIRRRATNLRVKFSKKLDFLFCPLWPQIHPKPQVLYTVGKLI